MVRHLLFTSAVDTPFPDVKGAVLLREVIERLAVAGPYRGAVLATEGGEFGIAVVAAQPDVAGNGRLVVLAEVVLIALHVMVEQVATAIDADILHRQNREEPWPTALRADAIHLREVFL